MFAAHRCAFVTARCGRGCHRVERVALVLARMVEYSIVVTVVILHIAS